MVLVIFPAFDSVLVYGFPNLDCAWRVDQSLRLLKRQATRMELQLTIFEQHFDLLVGVADQFLVTNPVDVPRQQTVSTE